MALSAVKGWSNPVDLFSSSAQTNGTGDAVASSCTGPDCLYFNPGRLCLGGSPRILAGVTAQHASLSVPGGSTGITARSRLGTLAATSSGRGPITSTTSSG